MGKYFLNANSNTNNTNKGNNVDANANDPISRTARIIGLMVKATTSFTDIELKVLESKAKILGAEFLREQISAEHSARQASAARNAEMFASFCSSALGQKIADSAIHWVDRMDQRLSQFESAQRHRRMAMDENEFRIDQLNQEIEIARLEKQLVAEKQGQTPLTYDEADEADAI